MATERTAAPGKRLLPEFLKFTRIGQQVCGRITKYEQNKNGPFVVMEPVLVMEKDGTWSRYAGAALGLTTDLGRKIIAGDVGKFLQVVFRDTEPTDQGSDKKIFAVLDLDNDEIRAIAAKTVDRRAERAAQETDGKAQPLFPEHAGASTALVDELFT